jgi:micrococcal nuclease
MIQDTYTRRCELIKVIDGDTIKVRLDLGFDCWRVITLRLLRVQAPESKTEQGPMFTLLTTNWLKSQATLHIKTVKEKKDRYARYLAEVYGESGENLNDYLLQNGCPAAPKSWG